MAAYGNSRSKRPRKRTVLWAALLVTAPVMLLPVGPTEAGTTSFTVLRVEEDWRMVLNEPGELVNAPQWYTVMSPFGHTDSMFVQVSWNFRELPDYMEGGLQIQGWNGDNLVRERSFESAKCSDAAETITWTQVLDTDGTYLTFMITSGNSSTWGSFGYPSQNMHISGNAGLADLNSYAPNHSAANSAITFGDNRVERLEITEVRWYGPSGLIYTDPTTRTVFQNN